MNKRGDEKDRLPDTIKGGEGHNINCKIPDTTFISDYPLNGPTEYTTQIIYTTNT